jgi:hypothetical protein
MPEGGVMRTQFVLVRGVVYKLCDLSRRPLSNPQPKYYRRSVPSDYKLSNWRSRWPAAYALDKIPEHEVIDEARATEVIEESMKYLRGGE